MIRQICLIAVLEKEFDWKYRRHCKPFLSFVFQYDVVNDGNQEVHTEVQNGVDPYQFIDAAFPSAGHTHTFHRNEEASSRQTVSQH